MSEAKFPRIKLPPELNERRQWGSNRGGRDSCVKDISLSAVEVRPEAPLIDNMPDPVNRAERRYRDRMLRRTSAGSPS